MDADEMEIDWTLTGDELRQQVVTALLSLPDNYYREDYRIAGEVAESILLDYLKALGEYDVVTACLTARFWYW